MINNKKGQLAIFIILAIVIIIIVVLLIIGKGDLTAIFSPMTPIEQIKQCAQEPIEEALEIVSLQGGSISPELYILYEDNKVGYLCYIEENYKTCVMQKPLLKQSIEKEIEAYVSPRIKSCIESAKADLQGKGYTITMSSPEISVSLVPNNALVNIKTDLKIIKDKTELYKSIKTEVSSKLYDMVMISSSISNWEARYGDAEIMSYMIYYPDLRVEKKKQGDGSTIYILTDKASGDKFIFASKSLVFPPGLTG